MGLLSAGFLGPMDVLVLGELDLRLLIWNSSRTGMASMELDLLSWGGLRERYQSGSSMQGMFRISQNVVRSSGTLRLAVRPCVDAERQKGNFQRY